MNEKLNRYWKNTESYNKSLVIFTLHLNYMRSGNLFYQGLGVFFMIAIGLTSCKKKDTRVVWNQGFPVIGSQSSPRATDLNGDGTDDLVLGACKNEYQSTDYGVIALDGKTGNMMWHSDSRDQVYGSATLVDITGDSIKDVIIGGRWAYLRALNGSNGDTLWNYSPQNTNDPVLKYARFNFFNSVLVPDQNGDGIRDILIQNGGNHAAKPQSFSDRFPGVLMLMDSRTGSILAADTMPDGHESYMSPLYFEQPNGNQYIVFGSGGETASGSLFVGLLSDLKNKKLVNARAVATDTSHHGFIAPPVLADLNQDGFLDIVAISHSSRIFAVDGKTMEPLWNQLIPGTESSNSFAVGQFTGDATPDLFTFVSKGEWPNSRGSLQVLLDGKDGSLAYQDSLGCAGFSSPVAYDLNGDGIEEAILSINIYDCSRGYAAQSKLDIENRLIAIDFKARRVIQIDHLKNMKNIFSTPWIGDLDHDGYLDIVHSQFFSPNYDLLVFLGMQIKRISTSIRYKQPVRWGGYMGSNGDGIYSSQ